MSHSADFRARKRREWITENRPKKMFEDDVEGPRIPVERLHRHGEFPSIIPTDGQAVLEATLLGFSGENDIRLRLGITLHQIADNYLSAFFASPERLHIATTALPNAFSRWLHNPIAASYDRSDPTLLKFNNGDVAVFNREDSVVLATSTARVEIASPYCTDGLAGVASPSTDAYLRMTDREVRLSRLLSLTVRCLGTSDDLHDGRILRKGSEGGLELLWRVSQCEPSANNIRESMDLLHHSVKVEASAIRFHANESSFLLSEGDARLRIII